jgi:hypothetical protein
MTTNGRLLSWAYLLGPRCACLHQRLGHGEVPLLELLYRAVLVLPPVLGWTQRTTYVHIG